MGNIFKDLYQSVDSARAFAAQATCWCCVVVLNQKYGIGRKRFDRCAEAINSASGRMASDGYEKTCKRLREKMNGATPRDFRPPVIVYPKKRSEKEIVYAMNEAATASWLMFADAVHTTLGFGPDKLLSLHDEAIEMYREFNRWISENSEVRDGNNKRIQDWNTANAVAMERLRGLVQRALRDDVRVADADDPNFMQQQLSDQQAIESAQKMAVMELVRRKERPLAVLSEQEIRRKMEILTKPETASVMARRW